MSPQPSSSAMADSYGGSMAGTLAYLLPYVEQDNVYKQFASGVWQFPSTVGYYSSSATYSSIKTYVCPSDNAAATTPAYGPFAFLVYYPGSMTGWYFGYNGNPDPFGRTNYSSNAGYLGNMPGWPYPGPYAVNTKQTTVTISDGSSNTFAFGECLGGNPNGAGPGKRDFVALWYSFNLPTAWGLSSNPQWYQYGSRHSNSTIINFAFCDGSVRGIKNSVNSSIFIYASGKDDGAVFNANDL